MVDDWRRGQIDDKGPSQVLSAISGRRSAANQSALGVSDSTAFMVVTANYEPKEAACPLGGSCAIFFACYSACKI